MNDYARRMIMGRGRNGSPRGYDMSSRGNYEVRGDFESYPDGRRGVKGTGRYGIGGSRYYPRRDRAMAMDDYDYDEMHNDYGESRGYRDEEYYPYDYNMRDYGDSEKMKLSKREIKRKERELINADGSPAPHFKDMQQIMNVAQQVGAKYDGYDEADFCFVMNMLYSDYCLAVRKFVPQEREMLFYAELAKAWLDDEDAPEGSEKLYLYIKCVVDEAE